MDTTDPDPDPDLPWALKAYNAIVGALYQLEDAPLSEEDRKKRAIEILREIEAPPAPDGNPDAA
jgi:hypothetical protein